jgi:hypothetical protein
MMALDRAEQINQSTINLVNQQLMPREGAKIINTAELYLLMVKKLGGQIKDTSKFLVDIMPEPMPEPELEGSEADMMGLPSLSAPLGEGGGVSDNFQPENLGG